MFLKIQYVDNWLTAIDTNNDKTDEKVPIHKNYQIVARKNVDDMKKQIVNKTF